MADYSLEALITGLSFKGDMEDGLTVNEIAVNVGRNAKWVREKLNLLNAAGRLIIGKKKIIGLDGRETFSPAYKVKPDKPVKKGKTK